MFRAAAVTSMEKFSFEGGERLGAALVEKLGASPRACWLFAAPGDDLQGLLDGVLSAAGTGVLAGCTTDGEICGDELLAGAAVLGGVASDSVRFSVASTGGLDEDSEKAGRRLAAKLPRDTAYVQLFSDGLRGNGCALLRGMASVLGPEVPVSGGTAGDGGRFLETWQFAGREVLAGSAVAMGLSGDFRVGTGVASGWSPVGIAKRVTRARGNVVYELNHQPALEVYERFLGRHADRLPSVGVEYPLGLVDPSGHGECLLLRATMSVNRSEGSIAFSGEVPEGSMVRLTCGDHASVLKAARRAARQALDRLEGRPPVMAFVYSCMARKIVLGRRTREEILAIGEELGASIPMLGFYTYGEYSPLECGSANRLHNETATVAVLGI